MVIKILKHLPYFLYHASLHYKLYRVHNELAAPLTSYSLFLLLNLFFLISSYAKTLVLVILLFNCSDTVLLKYWCLIKSFYSLPCLVSSCSLEEARLCLYYFSVNGQYIRQLWCWRLIPNTIFVCHLSTNKFKNVE